MVSYKGGLIDIEKLLEQMKRSEKARDETEQLLVDLRKTNAELIASNSRSKDKIKDLQSSLKSSNRKLNDTEQQLSTVNVSDFFKSQAQGLFKSKILFLYFRKRVTNTIPYWIVYTIVSLPFLQNRKYFSCLIPRSCNIPSDEQSAWLYFLVPVPL